MLGVRFTAGDIWAAVAVTLVVGYLTMTRSFAYVGVPAINLYLGEIVLALFVIFRLRTLVSSIVPPLVKLRPTSTFVRAAVVFFVYGVLEAVRGVSEGYPAVVALQNLAFHYYVIYIFIGFWLGCRYPGLLHRGLLVLAWVNGLYGIGYILFLNDLPLTMPGTADIPLFGQPAGAAIAIFGLLAVARRSAASLPLILLNLFVLFGISARASWVAFAAGLFTWGVLGRRVKKFSLGVAAVVGLFLAMYIFDVHFIGPDAGTGRSITSVREIAGGLLAPFDVGLGAEFSEHAEVYAGTLSWRLTWWMAIWNSVHGNVATALFGHGYGYPLAALVGYSDDIRSPHNILFYVLGYTGWLGIGLFVWMQYGLFVIVNGARRISGSWFGVIVWIVVIIQAVAGNVLESPFGAIPFYILLGLSGAPLLAARNMAYAHTNGAQLLPVSGR